MKRVQTKTTHTDEKTPLSLTNFFRTYIQTKHIQKKKTQSRTFPHALHKSTRTDTSIKGSSAHTLTQADHKVLL